MRNSDDMRSSDQSRYDRDDRDSRYGDDRYAPNYDSHYDEGEDHVGFVNIIDMDIPFFQLVWLIFKVFLAAIVAASMIALLAMLLNWILMLPIVRDILPDNATWLTDILNPGGS